MRMSKFEFFPFQEVRETIRENDFYFIQSKLVKWQKNDAEKFYEEHKGKRGYKL